MITHTSDHHRPPGTARWVRVTMLAAAITITAHPLALAEEEDNEKPVKARSTFPTLDILPPGSVLSRVRLPRYDKDFNPTTLLMADKLTVLDEQKIDAEGVTIQKYAPDGSLRARTKLRKAVYDQKNSTLHAKEAVFLEGGDFKASGSGMIFDWENQSGFLIGPVTSQFKLKPPSNKTSSMPKIHLPLHPAKPWATRQMILAAGMSTTLLAVPPKGPTPKELAELDRLSKPMTSAHTKGMEIIKSAVHEESSLSKLADDTIMPFLKKNNLKAQLAQNPAPPKPEPAKPEPAAPAAVNLLRVECDGGLYFDSDEGILAYLKNIRLVEPRFRLSCAKELKVFLEQKPEEKPAEAPNDKPAEEAEPEKEKPLNSFGDVKTIIATGSVKITRKDDKGKVYIASAETASFDAKTGRMILRGGKPRIQVGKNQFLQSMAPGQHILILKNGKFIAEGQWKMQIAPKQN